jgi:hypothetical protein
MSHQSNNRNACQVCYQEGVTKEQMYMSPCGHSLCLVCVDSLVSCHCRANTELYRKLRREEGQDVVFAPAGLACPVCREENFLGDDVEEEEYIITPEMIQENPRVYHQLFEEQDAREHAGIYFNAQWRSARIAELFAADAALPRPTLRHNDYFEGRR